MIRAYYAASLSDASCSGISRLNENNRPFMTVSAYRRWWLVVEAEQDPAKAHPLTYARMGHDGVTRALAAAGL